MTHKIYIFFLLACLPIIALGQQKNIKFRNLNVEDGLSHSWVKSVAKDSRGFIWIGTLTGLNRYDGYDFKVFQHDENDPRSLGDDQVARIFEDSKGRLWVSTANAGIVNLYHPESEDFDVYKLPGRDLLEANLGHVATDGPIFEDSRGNLWVGTEFGVTLYDSIANTFNQFPLITENNEIPSSTAVYSITEDDKGVLWFGTLHGVIKLNPKDHSTKTYVPSDDPNSISYPLIKSIHKDENGNIWLGTFRGGINLYDPENDNFIRYQFDPNNKNSLSSNAILSLEGNDNGKLFIGTENGGLNIFDLETKTFQVVKPQIDYDFSLSSNSIYALFYDNESQILWVGTFNGGVDYISPWAKAFIHHKAQLTRLNNNKVTDLLEDEKGNLWIGTDGGGLNVRSAIDGSYKYYQHDLFDQNSIMSNAVLAILNDSEKNIWIGTYDGGLDLLNKKTDQFIHYRYNANDPYSLGGFHVSCLYEDNEGNIWVGMFDAGVSVLNKATGKFTRYLNDSLDNSTLSNNFVQSIHGDSDGRIFVTTMNDIDVFNPEDGTFSRFDEKNLSGVRRAIVEEDSKNNLWIGSASGLHKYNKSGNLLKHYTTSNGLPDNNITGILEDPQENLWISTHNGLVKFENALSITDSSFFRSFSVQEGLQGAEFKIGSYLQGRNGLMYFGGQNGYNSFDPELIVADPNIPPVVITNFKIFNKNAEVGEGKLLEKPILELEEIVLTHEESVFTFEFAALGYSLPIANTYAYKMDGFEDDWNYVGNTRSATYTNLDQGDYIFRVKAANGDGVWNEQGSQVRIKILPPFYQTWYFRTFTAITLVTLILLYNRYRTLNMERTQRELESKVLERTHELERKNEELAVLNEEKQLAQQKMWESEKMAALGFLSAGVAHEINNPLGFIKGGVEALPKFVDDGNKDIQKLLAIINEGVRRTTTIVKSLSHFSRTSIKMNEKLDLHDILDNCLVLLENKLKHKIELKKTFINDKAIIEGNEGRMHQAILNLIANAEQAIEDEGKITITTATKQNRIMLKITDTGSGISSEDLPHIMAPFFTTKAPGVGTGLGLSITYNIVEEHHGTIKVDSKLGKGTTFTLEFEKAR